MERNLPNIIYICLFSLFPGFHNGAGKSFELAHSVSVITCIFLKTCLQKYFEETFLEIGINKCFLHDIARFCTQKILFLCDV